MVGIKKIAPSKSTGGGGYNFEDKVGAHFLLCMLSGEYPLSTEKGLIHKVAFQNNVDGWLIDDILLELSQNSRKVNCAISVKSDSQFNTKGAPADFVSTVWLQLLEQNPQVYNPNNDILAIATNTLPSTVRDGINKLLKKAHSNHEKLHERINTTGFASQIERVIYKSFDCPSEIKIKHNITPAQKDLLLNSIFSFEYDFDDHNSQSEKNAIRLAQSILETPTPENAQLLWSLLQQIAKDLRANSGATDKNKLLSIIGNKLLFKLNPQFESDWKKIDTYSSQQQLNIRDTIGTNLKLHRTQKLKLLNEVVLKYKKAVILGTSGAGKTVLAKRWADSLNDKELAIWLRADNFNMPTFALFESSLGIKHSIQELLNGKMGRNMSIVIDGLDRLFSYEGFDNLVTFLKLLNINDFHNDTNLLLTCQPEEWTRCKTKLNDLGIDTSKWQLFPLNELDGGEFKEVLREFPELNKLSFRKELRSLLYRPKVLDLLAKNSELLKNVDTAKWIGESDLINWFWDNDIAQSENAIQKKTVLKKIAEVQGDKLNSEVMAEDLDPAYLTFIDPLIKDRILKRQGEGFNFDHDSYGDWIRQRILLEKLDKNNLSQFLEDRVSSPLWDRAIRLCSVHLIEQGTDLEKWKTTVKLFDSEDPKSTIAQDFFLEGVIFSTDPLTILEKLWPDLIANNAKFLSRLLGRFLHVATIPNPSMIEFSKNLGEEFETEAATIHRIPYWPYWLPMLNFLYLHKEDIINKSPISLSKITDSWLRLYYWESLVLKKEAADMALLNAEKVLRDKREGVIYVDHIDKPIFRAALATYKEYPERLKKLVDEASGRVVIPKIVKKTSAAKLSPEKQRLLTVLGSDFDSGEMMKPWPKGPKVRPDDSFEDICLNTDALYPIIRDNPKYAAEIILTLLISPPTTRSYRWNRDPIMDNLDINHLRNFYPPFYDKGSFLFFLRTHPQEGLDLIIELVNFAADRWADRYREEHKRPPTINIEIEGKNRKLYRSAGMYFWYQYYPPVPDVIACALISLEKWLYELLEERKPIDAYIKHILNETNNIAFLGLLSAVGRKNPSLFLTVLKPLLSVFLFFIWEDDFMIQSGTWQITWSMRGDKAYEEAQKWYTMKHRSSSLTDWAKFLFLNQPDLEKFFIENHKKWTRELKTKQIDKDRKLGLLTLLAAFDKKNYHLEEKDGEKYWMFQHPAALKKEIDKRKEISKDKLLLSSLPMDSSNFLEKGQDLTDEQAEGIWKNIEKINKTGESLLEEDKPDAAADAISGGIALLCKFKFDWLKKDQHKYKWCLNYLTELVNNPPKRAEFDTEHSATKFHWDCFCSVALPYFWADDLDSGEIRKCIAMLVASYHYTAVSNLFQTCANIRAALGDEFKKLQHYLFNVAAAKSRYYEVRYDDNPSFDFQAWLKQEAAKFAEDKIDSVLPKWSENVIKDEKKILVQNRKRSKKYKHRSGLDTHLLMTAYQWLPLLRDAKNSSERQDWITFLTEALKHMLNSLGEENEEYEELEGVPSQWDYWVINRIAILSVELEPTEKPELLWKPILELSGYARYYVEHFLDDFFMYGPRLLKPDHFLNVWHQMLDYAYTSPKWSLDSNKYSSWTLGDFWWKLIGLDISKANIALEKQKELIKKSDAYIEKWAKSYLHNHRCALKFIYFLTEPVGEDLQLRGLIWLANSMDKLDSYYFWSRRGDSAEKALASLLVMCWTKKKALKNDKDAFNAFSKLLNILVARQNNVAMELQDKISI